MKKAKMVVLSLFLMIIALSTAAGVSGLWTGRAGKAAVAGTDLSAGSRPIAAPSFRLAQTDSVLVLGAGLIFLGLYAKLKRAK